MIESDMKIMVEFRLSFSFAGLSSESPERTCRLHRSGRLLFADFKRLYLSRCSLIVHEFDGRFRRSASSSSVTKNWPGFDMQRNAMNKLSSTTQTGQNRRAPNPFCEKKHSQRRGVQRISLYRSGSADCPRRAQMTRRLFLAFRNLNRPQIV